MTIARYLSLTACPVPFALAAPAITHQPAKHYTAVGGRGGGVTGALLSVSDPSHGSDKSVLLIDAHQYCDANSGGTDSECTHNGVDTLATLGTCLSSNGRKAIISETGGGNTDSCQTL
ncbi:hypothetical protein IAR50_001740 [Cryptococcus sp. DSM 104548]